MVLAHSLRDAGTKKKLAVLVILDSLQQASIDELRKLYDYIIPVDRYHNKSPANLYIMNRPDLTCSFTKINLWRQGQFRKIVYVDADVVALRAPDELFDLKEQFSAAPDIGWPDCFNSGVMVLNPNMGDFYSLLALAERGISFDGADQGLLNTHFKNFHRISFAYNCTPSGNYQYVPAYRHFQSTISMVHFIGADKPWALGRESQTSSPVYEELLGRWWAVYDQHFRDPMTAYVSGQASGESRTVQQYVKGESAQTGYGFSSAAASRIEEPVHERADVTQNLEALKVPPVQTDVHGKFSAPSVEWDPARSAPPVNSRPEAANIPQTTYQMSKDPSLYRAPESYPEPSKDLNFPIPQGPQRREKLKPIFPWEEWAPKATRVFPGDTPPSPSRSRSSGPSATNSDTQTEETSPATPTIQLTPSDPWNSFTRVNVWDTMPEIERYMRNLQRSRRGKVQVLHGAVTPEVTGVPGRRPSMKLTDFPTEIERPSLPVTPAPVRRPSFWGSERDEEGQLPAAEGVPKQEDWNPTVQLEELNRRQSAAISGILHGRNEGGSTRQIPDRELPGSAVALPPSTSSAGQHDKIPGNEEALSGSTGRVSNPPVFATPDLTGTATSTGAVEGEVVEEEEGNDPLATGSPMPNSVGT
ncbi:MAG: glycogenin glucosyltransferase [Sclerophora amabilis]|nr:MAG: glycogenin glucosyltransferase [Sclerophora amabilis]